MRGGLCLCEGFFYQLLIRTDENARPFVARIRERRTAYVFDDEFHRPHYRDVARLMRYLGIVMKGYC
ncbi:hypothetical protein D3C80_1523740 [compost metagenome]